MKWKWKPKLSKPKIKIDRKKIKESLPQFKTILIIGLLFLAVVVYNTIDSVSRDYNEKGFDELTEHMNRVYVPVIYDCDVMAKDFEVFFEDIGIDTDVAFGYNEDVGHCWLVLNFPDTSMEFECTLFKFKEIRNEWEHWRITSGWIEGDNHNMSCMRIIEESD